MSKLPAVPTDLTVGLRNYLYLMARAIDSGGVGGGTTADGATVLTTNDLKSGGNIFKVAQAAASTTTTTSTIPPKAINFQAHAGFTSVLLDWDATNYHYYNYAEIWRADGLNAALVDAQIVGTAPGIVYTDHVGYDKSYTYWVRFLSTGGTYGAFSDPANAHTVISPVQMIADMNLKFSSSFLSAALNAEIDKIAPLTSLQDTAESIALTLGQANTGLSAVASLKAAVLADLLGWQDGYDPTINDPQSIVEGIKQAMVNAIGAVEQLDTDVDTIYTQNYAAFYDAGGVKSSVESAITTVESLTLGIVGKEELERITWEGDDAHCLLADGTKSYTTTEANCTGVDTWVVEATGIKADLEASITSLIDLKTGIDGNESSKRTTWEGTEGTTGIKAELVVALASLTSLKTGIDSNESSKRITWEGTEGTTGIKAELVTALSALTSLKTGIDTNQSTKRIEWEGSNQNGGIKASLESSLSALTDLKNGIDTNEESKKVAWEGTATAFCLMKDGSHNTGVTPAQCGSLVTAGTAEEWVPIQTGVKAELVSTSQSAVNLQTGMLAEYSSKYLAWEGDGTAGNPGIKADIATVENFFVNMDAGLMSDVTQFQANWGNNVAAQVAEFNTSLSTIGANYTVKLDANGVIAGFGLANTVNAVGNVTTEFKINANQFSVTGTSSYNPSTGQTTQKTTTPFAVDATATWTDPQGVVHTGLTYIDNAMIDTASIATLVAGQITADDVFATGGITSATGNIGEVTAGVVKSNNDIVTLDLNNGLFTVKDDNGQVRVKMGFLG